jgi:transposase
MAMTTMTDPTRRVTAGIDTHKDFHVVAALDELGRELGVETFATTARGYRQVLRWLRGFGDIDVVGIEGTGAYGAALTRFLLGEGVAVIEVQRPDRQARRRHGKSDPTDARSAARAVLAGRETALPKTGDGTIECIRLLRVARRSAMKARGQVANQIHAVRLTAPEQLRHELDGLDLVKLVRRAARFHRCPTTTPAGAARFTLRSLARRWQTLDEELKALDAELEQLIERAAPGLLELNGVGVQCAATFLATAGDNPERLRNERSFAALCGVSPLDASSGKQQRHRLNRGGDREANAALYIVVVSRLRWDRASQAYMKRRVAEGRTTKEVIRCLKRYVAREIYRTITAELAITTHARPPAIAA